VDDATQAQREDLKKVARLALQAVADLEWPGVSVGGDGPDGTITVIDSSRDRAQHRPAGPLGHMTVTTD
jgi:hypothetical protein